VHLRKGSTGGWRLRPRAQILWAPRSGSASVPNGLSYTRAVETDLERATGVKPEVGFNWHNGGFQSVTVTFPRVYAGKPLSEPADVVREVVARDFKQTPDRIVLAFSLTK
jgi:hypothetical protein